MFYFIVVNILIFSTYAREIPPTDPPFDANADYLAETKAGLFEGDIDISIGDFRNIISRDSQRWTNGEVPYILQFSGMTKSTILSAMREIETLSAVNGRTCIKFVPRSNQRNYISVFSGSGCSSAIGMRGGMQKVSLGMGCRTKGIIMHELLHALGFWHEQSRPDRDQYVEILWNNIQSGKSFNFNKQSSSRTLGTPYDYGSIMHYGAYSFSSGLIFKKPTIKPKDSSKKIGQRKGLSPNDLRKLRLLYKCGDSGSGQTTSGSGNIVTTATPVTNGDCTNLRGDDYCKEWAGKGKCTTNENAQWMKIFCTKACNKCPPDSCQNKHPDSAQCLRWAQNGECYKNSVWMGANCSRACNTC